MQVIHGYNIFRSIYSNDKISIYRGKRDSDKESVILKVLNAEYPTEEDVSLLKHEYNLIKDLDLPGVIRAYGLEQHEHQYELVLEDIPDSCSLSELIAEQKISIEKFLLLAIQLAEALSELHTAHIIHKDINPNNIIISKKNDLVKLIDFSIATHLSQEILEARSPEKLEGTLAYISPEQTSRMNRAIDERTDLYSLGVTFYEMLTRQLPFDAKDPMEWIHCHIAKQPVAPNKLRKDIPEIISAIVMKLLSKAPEDRYATAYGLKVDLIHCLHSLQTQNEIQPFTLGKKDRSSVFHIPEKLYGREAEVQLLLNAFERVSGGGQELLLVSGSPGIGKSSLVNEVHKPIVRQRGYFASGKFDQFQLMPFGAVIQAFRKLIQQVLTENKQRIDVWREQLLKVLYPNAQVIIDVIPEVELLIGKQAPAPVLAPSEARNRFKLVFFDFIHVFTQAEHPLVIYLDDLQWADGASCNLIKELLRNKELRYLLIIGAYRDNEVNKDHPLMLAIDELNKLNVPISNVKLDPLDLTSITHLISDTLNTTIDIKLLVKLIHAKTAGTPFFVKEFLNDLHRRGYIKFNSQQEEWLWDIGAVRELEVTKNVVDLIMSKIQRLPDATRDLLKVAACMGNQFDLQTLALVYNKPVMEIAQILWIALEENLIISLNDNYKLAMVNKEYISPDKILYKFSHDRIQQAAYYMLSEQEQKLTNLKLGRILSDVLPIEEQEEKIFEIANHFNAGIDLLDDFEEKYKIAQLNLKAGQKAKKSNAYEAAENYFKYGLTLLDDQTWDKDYDLTFQLNLEYADTQYSLAHFDKAVKLFDALIDRTPLPLNKAKIILSQLLSYEMQCDYDKTRDLGIKGLNILGVNVSPYPNVFKVTIELFKAVWYLRNKKPEDLLKLPVMQDPEKKLIMDLVQGAGVSFYFKDPNLLALLSFRSVKDILNYGVTPAGIQLLANFGVTQIVAFKNYDSAYKYGQLFLNLIDKFDDLHTRIIIYNTVYPLIAPWKLPYKTCLLKMHDTYQMARQSGELQYAIFDLTMIIRMMLLKGESLIDINKKIVDTIEFVEFCNNIIVIENMRIWQKLIPVLRGEKPTHYFTDSMNDFFNDRMNTKDLIGLGSTGIIYLTISYILKDWPLALRVIHKTNAFINIPAMKAIFDVAEYYFFTALTLLSIYSEGSWWTKWKYRREINKCLKKLKLWAFHCPENFQSKYSLILAGKAAYIQKNISKAYEYYEQALNAAREQGFIYLIGIAHEFFSRIYLSQNQRIPGRSCLQEAIYAYQQWGAQGKVELLQKEFPEFNFSSSANAVEVYKATKSIPKSAQITQTLDLTSVLKSAQVISSHVKLEKLLQSLIQIMLENAGAERGLVLLLCNEQLLVEAEGHATQKKPLILQHQPVENRTDLSLAIVRYVQNARDAVVLDDAAHNGLFTEDSYIAAQKSLSVLCMPILHRDKLLGILYLENNLTAGAFTPQRLEVLKILASQMAISLENALLVTAYDQFVPHEFLDLLAKRSIIDIRLGDHVQKFMTVMFSDIRDFTQLSEKMTPSEIFAFVNEFLGYMEPIIKEHNGFIDKYIGDAIMALFPGDANNAVRTAIGMQQQLKKYNRLRIKRGEEPIRIGIGINCGSLMLGTLGSVHRLETSVLSDAVNVAARIEELTRDYDSQLLISEWVYEQLNKEYQLESRFVGNIQIRGKAEEIAIWEIYSGEQDEIKIIKKKIAPLYDEAIKLFLNDEYKNALLKFQQCLEQLPKDKLIQMYIDKCKQQF